MAEGIMRKFGFSVHEYNLNEEFFAACRDAGVYSVELSCNAPTFYRDMDWDAVCGMITKYGIVIRSVHLTFSGTINIADLNENNRESTMELHRFVLKKAAEHGIPYAIIHPSSEPIADEDRATAMAYAKENLHALVEFAAPLGITIAVEDLPRTCLGRDTEEMQELLSADPRLMACFDTNHLLRGSIADCVRAIGDRIVTLHVSDYDFIDERHLLPGELDVNWVEFMDLLDEIGYTGVFHYEVPFVKENRYIRREAPLTPMDFRRNFDSIAARAKPVLPKSELLYR